MRQELIDRSRAIDHELYQNQSSANGTIADCQHCGAAHRGAAVRAFGRRCGRSQAWRTLKQSSRSATSQLLRGCWVSTSAAILGTRQSLRHYFDYESAYAPISQALVVFAITAAASSSIKRHITSTSLGARAVTSWRGARARTVPVWGCEARGDSRQQEARALPRSERELQGRYGAARRGRVAF